MLFRLVRPVRRSGSRNRYFVRRIPADVRSRAAGLTLSVPVGDRFQSVRISPKAQSIRISLRTDDPTEVKLRQAKVDAYLENVWRALRAPAPVSLSHRDATALAGELYRAWAESEGRERTIGIEHIPGVGWQRLQRAEVDPEEWAGVLKRLDNFDDDPVRFGPLENTDDLTRWEKSFGGVIDRLLLAKGISSVDSGTREILLSTFAQAMRDAVESRKRNSEGDYSADAKAGRFPTWTDGQQEARGETSRVSLKGLVEAWWIEAKATGRKPSTYESYSNTMAAFVSYVGHDDASRIRPSDVISFKDYRLASTNPRTGTPVSAKTVKDSDLSGLKTIFGWAKVNGKIAANPAEGVTIKLGRPRRVRSKGFTDSEAFSILRAAARLKPGNERPETFAAKRWVPWLCAYTGARVGELAQLRKEDVQREGKHWTIIITPEAGTVKTNEARSVVLHPHLIEQGFITFVRSSSPGHLFIRPSDKGDVLGPLQGLKNRLAEFVRAIVPDKNVAPNHAWRHRFKTIGIEVGIEHRILDAIQGQRPRNVAEGYGEVTIKTQAAAISKLPWYRVRT
jgi:integrase